MRPANRQHGSRMAIDDLLDEHEQGERVRSWLRANGAAILGGIVMGLALIWGVQWWQRQQDQQQVQAATAYQAAIDQLQAGKVAEARPRIAALPEGIYDTLGALALAKAQVADGKRDDAIATLRAAKPHDPALDAIVRDRLARLLIDADKARDALALLATAGNDPQVLQLRGDAHTALDQLQEARAAYAQALVQLEVGAPQRTLVELKLAEVGGAPDDSKPTPPAPQEARG